MKFNNGLINAFAGLFTFLGVSAILAGLAYLFYFLLNLGIEAIVNNEREHDLIQYADCYYLVPDPIVAKEGENQWISLPYKDVHHKCRGVIDYKLNGNEYTTTMYIFCQPNNN